MKIVLAPDSFKESITATEATEGMKSGILKVDKNIEILELPMADGGEGTLKAIILANSGEFHEKMVNSPLKEKVLAKFGSYKDTIVIEMAEASGLALVDRTKRDPSYLTTYGTGELIKEALDRKAKNIIITLGGSATNDGGVGILKALGVVFLDKYKNELDDGGLPLKNLHKIDFTNLDKRIFEADIIVACDVNNKLLGNEGASYVFGPQKGASLSLVKELDEALENFSRVVHEQLDLDLNEIVGGGAAGGTGASIIGILKGRMKRGIDVVIESSGFKDRIKGADYIFTGEGGIDGQTILGKTIYGIAREGKKQGIPVIAFAGKVSPECSNLYAEGLSAVFCINKEATTLEVALKSTKENLELAVENVMRLIMLK
ncbi:MAG TPA: glycerate kinase [Clostridiaceae bacterium]